jgi:histone H3/H4
MAKIQEEVVVIRVSQLVREGTEGAPRVTEEVAQALQQVAEELVGVGAVVEIERA